MQLILKINELDLSSIVIECVVSSQAREGTIENTMSVVFRADAKACQYIDLRGRLKASDMIDGQRRNVFGGFINSCSINGSNYALECTDPLQLFKEAKAGGGFGSGLLPAEMVYYLAKEVSPDGLDAKNFSIGEEQTLADTSYVTRPRRFVYVAPLPSCVLRAGTGTLKIANCWIYSIADNNSADDRIIASFDDHTETWQQSETRVRFYVQAIDFPEALKKGRVRLQRLLDFISFGANYASATYPSKTGVQFFSYDRSRTLVDIEQTEWAFVRDTLSSDRYWMHWSAPHRDREPFVLDRQDSIVLLYEIFQELSEADDEDLTGKERSQLNALHALHQVRQAVDTTDALGHVWRCMEFLLSGYSTPQLFTDYERKSILKAAKSAATTEEQKKRLDNILGQQLNQTTLRTTWRFFCQDHSLEFPEDDEKFLWTLRTNRNHHQHGRSTEVLRSDIERAATMMEKALVAAITLGLEQKNSS